LTRPDTPRAAPGEEPVFAAPWEARAFALAVLLRDRGLFSGGRWAEALGAECAGGGPYYEAWLRALERLLAETGVAQAGEVSGLAEAWARAAEATPHGTPIRLENHRP
jgi:nitrile hydratase accessory protein